MYFCGFFKLFEELLFRRTSTNACFWKLAFFHSFIGLYRLKYSMAGRGRTTPNKNGANTPCLSPPAKHEKTPQLPPLQTKIFRVSRFAIFFAFFQVPPCWRGVPAVYNPASIKCYELETMRAVHDKWRKILLKGKPSKLLLVSRCLG